MYDNLLNDADMLTISSLKTGTVTTALKNGTGSAVITTEGDFSGTEDLEYTIEIDSVAGGKEVGQATFKWTDGQGSWNATGVTTSSSPITLNNGVNVSWASGTGDDFELEDTWYFKAVNLYNGERLLDWDRDSRYRSSALESPNTITIDLVSSQEIKALVIYDHNFTSNATITLKGHTSDSWGSPDFSEAVTWASDKILHYLSSATTKRYWRLEVTDAGNSDNYIEIGELFIGSYFEPAETFQFRTGARDIKSIIKQNKTAFGVAKKRFFNFQRDFKYKLNHISDIDSYIDMIETIIDRSDGSITPVYFNEDETSLSDFWMVELESLPYKLTTNNLQSSKLRMLEVVSSV